MKNAKPSLRVIEQSPLNIARAFVADALTGSPDTVMRFRLISDKVRGAPAFEVEGTVTEQWTYFIVRQSEDYGAFYFLNQVRAGLEGFASDADIVKVRAIPADFDKGIPDKWHSKPGLIVRTSDPDFIQRGQALWPVTDFPLDQFEPLCGASPPSTAAIPQFVIPAAWRCVQGFGSALAVGQ